MKSRLAIVSVLFVCATVAAVVAPDFSGGASSVAFTQILVPLGVAGLAGWGVLSGRLAVRAALCSAWGAILVHCVVKALPYAQVDTGSYDVPVSVAIGVVSGVGQLVLVSLLLGLAAIRSYASEGEG